MTFAESSEIEQNIRNIVADVSGLSAHADAEADLYLGLGMASVHALALLTELEGCFGVSIPDEEFVGATSISKLTAMLAALLKTHV